MHISRRDMLTAAVSTLAAAAAPRALAAWEPSDRYPDPAIQVLDPSFAKYRLNNAGIERLAVGMRWAEGPVWFGDGRYLLWSDAALDRITRWDEETGQVSIFRKPANKPNGLTRDRQGRLLTCEHAGRRVTRTEHLLRRFSAQPPVHGGEPLALCPVRAHTRSSGRLRME